MMIMFVFQSMVTLHFLVMVGTVLMSMAIVVFVSMVIMVLVVVFGDFQQFGI